MTHPHVLRSPTKLAALTFAAAIVSASAMAANTPQAEALARYNQERGACLGHRSSQDRTTCLQEADAAYAAARQGQLDDEQENFSRNALKRCKALPGEERRDCEARMQGQGTATGSVAGGGILRELVTIEVGTPTSPSATGQ